VIPRVNFIKGIHNFENNCFEKQSCFDNGKMAFFTAFFCNNNIIYSPFNCNIDNDALVSLFVLFACIVFLALLLLSTMAN